MLTLESLKTDVDGLRETVRMADSDSMEVRQLLTSHVQLINAMRANQQGIADKLHAQSETLAHQAEAIDSLVIAVNKLEKDMHGLDKRQDRMEKRQDRMEKQQDRMEKQQDRMEKQQDRMDLNIVAIMRHMGIDPVAK